MVWCDATRRRRWTIKISDVLKMCANQIRELHIIDYYTQLFIAHKSEAAGIKMEQTDWRTEWVWWFGICDVFFLLFIVFLIESTTTINDGMDFESSHRWTEWIDRNALGFRLASLNQMEINFGPKHLIIIIRMMQIQGNLLIDDRIGLSILISWSCSIQWPTLSTR